MVRLPFIKPEPPRPATALPIINISELRAAPQIVDPSSKRARKKM
jgi:hypothetical protein